MNCVSVYMFVDIVLVRTPTTEVAREYRNVCKQILTITVTTLTADRHIGPVQQLTIY